MTGPARVTRNDWSQVDVPDLGRWRPNLPVSVVIPAYNCQQTLDLTLASLSRQTYPADLMEVVVVDDGSDPPLRLGEIRPPNTRIVRGVEHGTAWGIPAAFNLGVRLSSGEIIQRLDADMVVFPAHIEAHARWHHRVAYAVTLGDKRFVHLPPPETGACPSPAEVAGAAAENRIRLLFDETRSEPHEYVDKVLRRTDNLRAANHLDFVAHVGATVALRRELFLAAGGMNEGLRRGSDTEFGYRLAQAGALFVPEAEARSWHLGRSHMMVNAKPMQRYSRPFLADVMPHPRWLRTVGGSGWSVPLVTVVMEVDGHPLERVRAAADAILRGDETDLRLLLVGPWASVKDLRQPVLEDSTLDLRLIRATYGSDPRVRFVERAPDTAFPSPYLLTLPPTAGLARSAVGQLVEFADQHQVGVVQVPSPRGRGEPVVLWRTSARARARWVGGAPLLDVVGEVYGARALSPDVLGVVDLTTYGVEALAAGIDVVPNGRGAWHAGGYVKVAGVRSLARATLMVAALAASRAGARVRRLVRRAAPRETVT